MNINIKWLNCNKISVLRGGEKFMKLGDVYKHKENNSIIQIDSFATRMGKFGEGDTIIVFRQIEKHNEFEIGSCLSFNGYGSQEEIEKEYELLVPQEKLCEYQDWNEIFKLLEWVDESKVLKKGEAKTISNLTVLILNHIAETTTYSLSDVYDAYQYNMAKYNIILDEIEIMKCMEMFGLYSIDTIVLLANSGE